MSTYFKTPVTWRKRLNKEAIELRTLNAEAHFHATALKKVRAAIGKDCVFLSHLKESGNHSFLVILNRDNKKTRTVITTGVSKASDFKAEHYKNLKEAIDGIGRS